MHDGRTVFLACMRALCSPGTAVELPDVPELGERTELDSAAAILLAMLDGGLAFGVSGSAEAQRVASSVCGLTGATRTDIPQADWVLVDGPAGDAIARARRGTRFAPETGATLVIAASGDALPMTIAGPGVPGTARTQVPLDTVAVRAFAAANADSPCGVDLLVVTGRRIIGLPRSATVGSF